MLGFENPGALIFALLMMGAAVGGVLGSLLASRVSAWLGSGPSLLATIIGSGATALVIGLAGRWWIAFLATVVGMFTAVLWNVITVSLRQTIIPDHLLGRVNSVYRFFGWGMMPIGSLLAAAIVYAALLPYAIPRLTTAKIEAARADAAAKAGGARRDPSAARPGRGSSGARLRVGPAPTGCLAMEISRTRSALRCGRRKFPRSDQ